MQISSYIWKRSILWQKANLIYCIILTIIRFHATHSSHNPDINLREKKSYFVAVIVIEDDEYNLSSSLNHGLSSYTMSDATNYKAKLITRALIRMNANTNDFCQIPRAGGLSYDVGRLGEAWNYDSNSHGHVDLGI
ncbi:uncharacterized protein EV154DRAFT_479767 [Mucor mucedo]|uniref:uncharacterized protein n=1 Tax=Mucor mucedo TaxID=29922 RepID=UPI00221FA9D1|nr:uncharacterized protein EV154DRAFT_479767 [Mucor mucedo]KAI7893098.1 hypothetical protein EV154DRAFT_479767 [Mucor mucedo]